MAKKDQYDYSHIDVLGMYIGDIVEIAKMYTDDGRDPEDIADTQDVTVADVHGAVWFYLDNKDSLGLDSLSSD